MTKPANIQLAPERHAQIQEIAEALGGLSIADTVGEMIRSIARRGVVELHIPGINIEIKDASDGVVIGFDDGEKAVFKTKHAKTLSAEIRNYIENRDKLTKLVNREANFTISRKVHAIKIMIPTTRGVEKTFTRDLARDFADLIDKALLKASQTA